MIRYTISASLLFLFSAFNIILFDFNKKSDISSWNIVDDRVMGGISQSHFSLTTSGHGKFYEFVTTESNGGFSSVDYDFDKVKVSPNDKIKIKLKGDGKTYQFRVKAFPNDRHNYIKEFATTGEWQNVEIPLSDMYASWRGNRLNIPNFDKNQITGITLMIANGKKQNFQILLNSIEVVN
ncbi:complex I intermediate-associated protein 30 (CIA30) [Nonlabens dokdonensis]|uniref:NADH:ubiquinone oxidoreductase complex I intermediate-associated protein 30 n=2 Tax=Nonlabens dokdonensis TaxID=328515 RepID=L7WEE1_NONDD|nr:CIA30 family protein [Nonlabens dokdonensis]AGC78489.1 NADH:ubiquinone oxidoreductase complex I intermediate-associated protein 30 [Nonlabens dokdonensis DSW-6]PZX38233.1 complex I intermediate-associated protein 30 (CIA30) [Nonlabens dokdonensis]